MNFYDMSGMGLSEEELNEVRKAINDNISTARRTSRHDKCLLCGKTGGFCNSHTIPRFCLENIAWNGKVDAIAALLNTAILKNDSGVNNAGTFHLICRDCDSRVFRSYEDPEAYANTPTEEMLNQMALKNSLRDIYKHEIELELYVQTKTMLAKKEPILSPVLEAMLAPARHAREMDIKECYEVFCCAKRFIENSKPWIELASFDLLDYITPVAYQGMIALATGVNGEVINNRFTTDDNYRIVYLHLAILPLQESTAIITFADQNDKRIKQFTHFLQSSPADERLRILNCILFMYTEDYFLSKQLTEKTTKSLERIAQMMQDSGTVKGYEEQALAREIKDYDLRRDIAIPNLLTKEYEVIK